MEDIELSLTPSPSSLLGESDASDHVTISFHKLIKQVPPPPPPPSLLSSSIAGPGSSSSGSAAAPTMKQILSNVSGSANPGEILALMGPSGSGKTTLLDCLSNRGIISSGTISINGAPLSKRHKRSIAYVMQSDIFFDHLTVRDQLLYVIPNQTQEPEPIKD